MSADVVYHQHISLCQHIWHSSSSVITAGMSSVCHLYMSADVVYHQHIFLCQHIWHSSSVITAGMSSVCLHLSLLDLSHVFFCCQVWYILSIFHCFFRSCITPPQPQPPITFLFLFCCCQISPRDYLVWWTLNKSYHCHQFWHAPSIIMSFSVYRSGVSTPNTMCCMFTGPAYPATHTAWFESMTACCHTGAQHRRTTPLCPPGHVTTVNLSWKRNILMTIFTTWLCRPSNTNSRNAGGLGGRGGGSAERERS